MAMAECSLVGRIESCLSLLRYSNGGGGKVRLWKRRLASRKSGVPKCFGGLPHMLARHSKRDESSFPRLETSDRMMASFHFAYQSEAQGDDHLTVLELQDSTQPHDLKERSLRPENLLENIDHRTVDQH